MTNMKNFTIANLMTGDLVITANGKRATVMLDTPVGNILRFHTEKNSFSYIDKRYNSDLTHNKHEGLTIVKVYRLDPTKSAQNKIGDLVANPDKMLELGKVVYDRDAVTTKPTIDSLITGDMLIHRNGKVSTVYKNTPIGDILRFHTEFNSFSYLSRYSDDLTHESKDAFDIVAVYRTQSDDPTVAGDYIGNPDKMLDPANELWSEGDFVASYFYDGKTKNVASMTVDSNDSDDDYDGDCDGGCGGDCDGCDDCDKSVHEIIAELLTRLAEIIDDKED